MPGKVLHTGTANPDATVRVGVPGKRTVAAERQEGYYWGITDVENSMALVATSAVACATITRDTNHLVRIEYRDVIVPKTPEFSPTMLTAISPLTGSGRTPGTARAG